MLSRRLTLAGSALAALSGKVAAQEDTQTDMVLLPADDQADAMQTVNDIVARLAGPDARLRAAPSRGIIDSATHLADRPAAVAAILPSVSLVYMRQSGLPEHVVYANRFIGRMGVSDLHILASRQVSDLRDLAGQKVAVGPKDGATQATAAVWLNHGPLRIEPVYLEDQQALAAVLQGQIPAMMLLARKPARLFFDVNLSDGVHFLPIGMAGGGAAGLFQAQIQPQDYPLLSGGEAGRGRSVPTLGVPLVLACYNWLATTPMFLGLARLSDLLIQHGSGLPGFDMSADVPGWQRFPPVAAWLARGGTVWDAALAERRSPSAQAIDTSRAAANTTRPAPAPVPDQAPPVTPPTPAQKERLFQQFLDWRRTH
ncbi:type 2 periplasmic-binding domain-containing protein [Rhodopila globiformis]|uniref:Uncharacterized protein n=1 Tax=Rhodopila globiformis TaxID=1071 RepID=A0A2S6N3F0_RHOGL|nr:hypothetical protein [Rhodopila globiformis]PPQ29145.1 hypothetical protein CCS01_22395 [Rhodopila globiformis]